MRKYKVGVVGATGMVGQRFVTLLDKHPWFELTAVAASSRSAGKSYEAAVDGRWAMEAPIPDAARGMTVVSAEYDVDLITERVDFVFSAVDMKKDDIRALEERYAKAECPVISNNSAHRWTPDVPMVIPEVNPEHLEIIAAQRKRLGTERGFIAVKSNCSIQNYVPALHPLIDFGPERVLACTYQGISGAGKTFRTWPEMVDNVIPLIPGEEEKSECEPLKVWGHVEGGAIVSASSPAVTTQCVRVPVTDGHMAAVFVSFERKPSIDEIKRRWAEFSGRPQALELPSAPKQFLHYFEEPDRPQTRPDRMLEGGMAISIGRLRADTQYDYKFICLAHNTLRAAAGGGVLLAELLCAEGYISK
ncbi:MAG: aspartate-semialdehyde dehydrogenase [Oscillospiraceae bacterium]|jgi:aspartate-semialdehyde dehydrogenase|nr:aspartate-semialdehyde dehydrogenase [Oscillospiraceae bacterium]